MKDEVFFALKDTFHFSAQTEILFKSLFNISEVSDGSFPEAKRVVSSANIKISDSISFTKSLMKILTAKDLI